MPTLTLVRDGDAPAPQRSTSRTSRWVEHGWWGVLLVGAGVFARSGPLGDNSFLTHWATGRLIRADQFPSVDPYTFTAGGEPWTVQSWGASWLYASLEALGGPAAIRLTVALATGAVVGLLWRLSRPAGGLVGRVLLVGMASVVGFDWWSERPQVFAFVCMGLLALVLAEGRSPWWLVPIFVVWVNLHGSFPLGFVLIVVWLTRDALERRRVEVRDVAVVAAAALGVVGGALVSPIGFDLVTFPFHMLSRGDSLRYIVEWQPPEPSAWYTLVFAVQVVGVVWVTISSKRWLTLVPLVFFVALASTSARNVPVASIALVALAAPAFAGIGELRVGAPPDRRRVAAVLALIGVLTLGGVGFTEDVDLSAYPVRVVGKLEQRGWVANPDVRVITHDYVGNYLEWRYGAAANTWIDDRAELLPPAAIEDYVRLLSLDEPHGEILDRWDADVVLWNRDEVLADELDELEGWRVVDGDKTWVVACRVGALVGC